VSHKSAYIIIGLVNESKKILIQPRMPEIRVLEKVERGLRRHHLDKCMEEGEGSDE
jgi:hypothetical protein